jgi:hypothetical protein
MSGTIRVDAVTEIRAAASGMWEHMVERLWQWDDDYKTKAGTADTYGLSGEHGEDARSRYPLREKLTRAFLGALADQLTEQKGSGAP